MKITKIQAYQVDLPRAGGTWQLSSGRTHSMLNTTVVEIQTDAGITGYGEVCPMGSFYRPAYATGMRAGLKELGPQLLGEDPLEIDRLNERMDYLFRGHPYIKSPIDTACWDILGKLTKLPVYTLTGGSAMDSIPLYAAIRMACPDDMAEDVLTAKQAGYKQFQVKLWGNPTEDIERLRQARAALDPTDILVGDTNTGWSTEEAIRVCNAVKDLDVYIEQPCVTYEECLAVRQRTTCPMILDECVTDIPLLARAHRDNAAEVFTLKISKAGGIFKTRKARDLCVALGMTVKIEDHIGGDIMTAAIAHLAQSTPKKNLFSSWPPNEYTDHPITKGAPHQVNGQMQATDKPGLGIEPIMSELGSPVLSI